ncbi:acetyl-CoA carboxylase biotin carboxylase subunit [Antarcticimicrobium luteum]|uniref:biotin carboxylase n=1 Tax=Antarcticimicrobium luteum TaxID=2547397 RepID=A0A4R5V1R5_9RHOB|nr:biotin carboxylase N-terminal domain-containing protein [Antarcticimicrobium luteum]TDK45702.1 ATP-grasp domain-containing protein [Antarcticimicrobium luteum]
MSISRIFVANRGEIALRVLRTAKEMGLETVLGVSEADRDGLPAQMADRAVVLGPSQATKSYLNADLVLHAARATGCDALHPGYGFLSEKPDLARRCAEEGITFIGPRPETIEAMGDKLSAIAVARAAEVATVPGTDMIDTAGDAAGAAEELGYPVVMKASAGGGGKGMFLARSADGLASAFTRASREAEAAFGDGRLYMERFVEQARHVEVQIIGDGEGNVLHFGDRDCSVQRRYQKLIEEAPVTAMPAALQERLHDAAVRLCAHAKYRGAGTVEFLYDIAREDFYFIEVNSRIQVEHPVTEEITGVDLIRHQILAASGAGLQLTQDQIKVEGHALEARINAEDAENGFSPAPGRITGWEPPITPGIRLDSHIRPGDLVPPFYDSMVGKLITRGKTRDDAIEAMLRAIHDFRIEGIKTTLPFAARIIDHPDFRSNRITTRWLEDRVLPALETA